MTDASPNGLASMTQARERRAKRTMPPPRHPIPTGTSEPGPAELSAAPASAESAAVQVSANDPVIEQLVSLQEETAQLAVAATTETAGEVTPAGEGSAVPRPVTLYLEEGQVDFLEEARVAGLISRPRLDISKSAVVRLALRRLQHDMSIAEIHAYLQAQPTDATKTGRKRR